MTPICFYHSADLDGVCSGAIVKHFVPDCELVGYDYGQPFPWDKVRPGMDAENDPLWAHLYKPENGYVLEVIGDPPKAAIETLKYEKRTVYMVDVSLPPEDMRRLAKVSNLVWIDHHASQKDLWAELQSKQPQQGLFRTGTAACELCWEFFNPLQDAPKAVRLLGRYDVWDKDHPEWGSKILPFQYGMRSLDGIYDPENAWWPLLINPPPEKFEDLLKFPPSSEWKSINGQQTMDAYGRQESRLFECRIPLDQLHPGVAENWVDGIQVIHAEIVDPAKHVAQESVWTEERGHMRPFLRLTGMDVRHKVERIIQHGHFILSYQAEVNRRAMETGAHEFVWTMPDPELQSRVIKDTQGNNALLIPSGMKFKFVDGKCERVPNNVMPSYRVLACNTIVFNSQFFDGFYDPEKHDVMCAYCQLANGKWKVSLYSTKPGIDCGAICKMFGGGGHVGAAGFICDKLPWEN